MEIETNLKILSFQKDLIIIRHLIRSKTIHLHQIQNLKQKIHKRMRNIGKKRSLKFYDHMINNLIDYHICKEVCVQMIELGMRFNFCRNQSTCQNFIIFRTLDFRLRHSFPGSSFFCFYLIATFLIFFEILQVFEHISEMQEQVYADSQISPPHLQKHCRQFLIEFRWTIVLFQQWWNFSVPSLSILRNFTADCEAR